MGGDGDGGSDGEEGIAGRNIDLLEVSGGFGGGVCVGVYNSYICHGLFHH